MYAKHCLFQVKAKKWSFWLKNTKNKQKKRIAKAKTFFSVTLEDIQSCVMPSQRHRDHVLSLYFFSLSIFSIFLFFVMQNFLFCAPTVFINACVGSLFFTM